MEPIRIDFLNTYRAMFRQPLTIYHLAALIILLVARHNLIDFAMNFFLVGINLLPQKLIVWPIRLALFFYPFAPKFHFRTMDCFFVLGFIAVELMSGSLVGTHVLIYCSRRPEYCFDINEVPARGSLEFEEKFLDFSIQLFLTIYLCCLTTILKNIKKEIMHALRYSNAWIERNMIGVLALSNILLLIIEFKCIDGALKMLLIYMLCKVIYDIYYPPASSETIMIIRHNRVYDDRAYVSAGFVFRDALEPGEHFDLPDRETGEVHEEQNEQPAAHPEEQDNEDGEEPGEQSEAQRDEADNEHAERADDAVEPGGEEREETTESDASADEFEDNARNLCDIV